MGKHKIKACDTSRFLSGLAKNEGEEGVNVAYGDFLARHPKLISDSPCVVLKEFRGVMGAVLREVGEDTDLEVIKQAIDNIPPEVLEGDLAASIEWAERLIDVVQPIIDKALEWLDSPYMAYVARIGGRVAQAVKSALLTLKILSKTLDIVRPLLKEAKRRDLILKAQCERVKKIC